MTIEWDKKYELGHERIDFEHRIFVDLIKAIEGLDGETEKDKATRLLSEVEKYAIFHFLSEENIMIDVDYPGYEKHKEAHKQLLSIFGNKIYDFQNDNILLPELLEFLFDWFALHTTQVDMNLTRYIEEQNR